MAANSNFSLILRNRKIDLLALLCGIGLAAMAGGGRDTSMPALVVSVIHLIGSDDTINASEPTSAIPGLAVANATAASSTRRRQPHH